MRSGIGSYRAQSDTIAEDRGFSALVENLKSRNLTEAVEEEILGMCCSPKSKIGRGALNNIVTRFQSRKNGGPRLVESSSVELQFAYELERDRSVIAWFTQVSCQGVERVINSRRHVSASTVDFLVVRENSITLVECKDATRLRMLCATKPEEWSALGRQVIHLPLQNWAENRCMRLEVWSPRALDSTWCANLELMYTAKHDTASATNYLKDRIDNELRSGSITVREAKERIRGLTDQQIAILLWDREIYGPERRVRISDSARFHLFRSEHAASEHEEVLEKRASEDTSPVSSWISEASSTDFGRGMDRLREVRLAIEEGRPLSRREKKLVGLAKKAELEGLNPVQALITNFQICGNRTRRISEKQVQILECVVKEQWEGGKVGTLATLHSRVNHALEAAGCGRLSLTTVSRCASKIKKETRALNMGGMRKFHAEKTVSDPRKRTLRAQASLQVVQIDATAPDQRIYVDDEKSVGRSTMYLATCSATRDYVALSIGLGKSDRYALGALIRALVRRHGRLPDRLMVDRGPELTSKYLSNISDRYGVSVSYAPTGGAESKADVESAFNRANRFMFDELPGSMKNDKQGRSVDSRFKGNATVAFTLSRQIEVVEEILLQEIPKLCDQEGNSPRDRFNDPDYPRGGKVQELDEELMFWTSVPSTSQKIDDRRGLQLSSGDFSSDELISAARRGTFIEARLDCEDISVVWARTSEGIVKAWNNQVLTTAGKTVHEKKVDHFVARSTASRIKKERAESVEKIRNRVAEMAAQSQVPKPEDRPESEERCPRAPSPPKRIVINYDEIPEI